MVRRTSIGQESHIPRYPRRQPDPPRDGPAPDLPLRPRDRLPASTALDIFPVRGQPQILERPRLAKTACSFADLNARGSLQQSLAFLRIDKQPVDDELDVVLVVPSELDLLVEPQR